MIEIKDRFTNRVLYRSDKAIRVREAVLQAIAAKADLRYANLRSADLSYADLRYANLRSADLSSANLSYADLRYANLRSADLSSANLSSANLRSANLSSADLSYADLRYANLRSADLSSANLSYADLRSADLSYADLSSADLRYANLRSADLSSIKQDLFDVLFAAPGEIKYVCQAAIDGKINGSVYKDDCGRGCLVGSIAIARGCAENEIEGLTPDSNRPIERFVMGIKPGDTPETSQFCRLLVEWIDEFEAKLDLALAARK